MTRLPCPISTKNRLREEQHGKCAYCNIPTNAQILRNGSLVQLSEEFDHFVPISYGSSNSTDNWVLSCNVCNGLKSDHIFRNLRHAQIVIEGERSRKGYEDAWAYHRRTIFGITEETPANPYNSVETDIYEESDNPDDWAEPTKNPSLSDPRQYDGIPDKASKTDKPPSVTVCDYLATTGKVCMYCHGYNEHRCLLLSRP